MSGYLRSGCWVHFDRLADATHTANATLWRYVVSCWFEYVPSSIDKFLDVLIQI